MGFASLIRSSISLANSLTEDLQVLVQHKRWIGMDDFGQDIYDEILVDRRALVENKPGMRKRADGSEVIYRTSVTFIGPVAALDGVTDRSEPFDLRDFIVMPDGTTGPILEVNGLLDPVTGKPYMYQVMLGSN